MPIIHIPNYPKNARLLPAPNLKNKSGGGKGPLNRPDICSKDTEHVTHLQKMPVTPGYDPGTFGLDKDGVDGGFGSFTETAVNDFQEKNMGREETIQPFFRPDDNSENPLICVNINTFFSY